MLKKIYSPDIACKSPGFSLISTKGALLKIFLAVLACYLGLVVLAYIFQRALMFPAPLRVPDPDAAGLPGLETVRIESEPGLVLTHWLIPANTGTPDAPYAILFHGNAETFEAGIVRAAHYVERGAGVFLVSCRGYNGNPGKPSETGYYKDASAAIDWLLSAHKIPENRLILQGASLGTGVAVEMARRYKDAAALILETPYDSIARIAQHHYFFLPAYRLLKDRFESDAKIGALEGIPKLFVIGGRDMIVPNSHSLRLYSLAAEPKTLVKLENAGHNSLYQYGADETIGIFLTETGLDKDLF